MSRRVVDAVQQLREHHRFMKGLFAWVGFPSIAVAYDREPRGAGHTKWSFWQLWNLAIEGITGFSVGPLKLATYLGLAVALFAVVFGAQLILRTLIYGNPVAGYPSLMAVMLFLGGTQLVTLGIMGEYLGRVFNETKRRPLYLVERYVPSGTVTPIMSPSRTIAASRVHAPAFGAGGTQRQHHPAIIRGRNRPRAACTPSGSTVPHSAEQPARIAHRARAIAGRLVPERRIAQHRARIATAQRADHQVCTSAVFSSTPSGGMPRIGMPSSSAALAPSSSISAR